MATESVFGETWSYVPLPILGFNEVPHCVAVVQAALKVLEVFFAGDRNLVIAYLHDSVVLFNAKKLVFCLIVKKGAIEL